MSEENKLKLPEGVSSQGPVMDLSEAYLKSMIALPEILVGIANVLEGIDASLDKMALYFERRGLKEEYISQEDLEEDDAEDEKDGTN